MEPLSTEALAERELDNVLRVWEAGLALDAEALFERDGSVAWFSSGLPIAFLNEVLTCGLDPSPATLERAVATLRERGNPFIARTRDGIDDAAVPVLERLGLREDPEEALPGMAMHPIDAEALASPAPAGLEVRRVEDAAGLADHHEVLAGGFGMPLDIARRLIPEATLGLPTCAIVVGYADGTPVVTAMAATFEGTVGVYNVATLEGHRRLGYGEALTRRAVLDGVARGATVAILQSSPMGRGIYERIGFREVVRYRVFVES